MMVVANSKSEEVLQRAIEIFGTNGYRKTSVSALAEQVNLSKSALYHYFKSKEDLLVAIYKSVIEKNIQEARKINDSTDQPDVALRRMLVDRVVYTCHNRQILQIFHEEEAELPKRLMREVVSNRRAYQSLMTDLLDRGREQGFLEFKASSSVVANTLLGACNWSYKWYNPQGAKSPEELAEEVVDVLMCGIVPAKTPRAKKAAAK